MFTKIIIILALAEYINCMAIPCNCFGLPGTCNCKEEIPIKFQCLGPQGFYDCDETPIYNCDRSIEYTRVPDTCDQYYICDVNGPFIMSCDSGYQFDLVNRICKPAEEVKCGTTINTDWEGEENITIDVYF